MSQKNNRIKRFNTLTYPEVISTRKRVNLFKSNF